MHFEIFKIIATRGLLTAVECTKSVFGRGSAPDPAGGAHGAPRSPSRLGRGTPPPHSHPSTPSASRSRRLRRLVLGASAPRSQNPIRFFFWIRPCPIWYHCRSSECNIAVVGPAFLSQSCSVIDGIIIHSLYSWNAVVVVGVVSVRPPPL